MEAIQKLFFSFNFTLLPIEFYNQTFCNKYTQLNCELNDTYLKQVKDLEQASKVKNPMQFPTFMMSVSSEVKLLSGSWGRESTRGWPLQCIINLVERTIAGM